MHLRRMQPSDISDASRIAAASFKEDIAFVFMCPRRNEYPEDFRRYFARSLQGRLSQLGFVCLVAETEESDPCGKKVVGFAVWERIGNSEEANAWKEENSGLSKFLRRQLFSAEKIFVNALGIDRSVDHECVARFYEAVRDDFPEEIFPDHWYLHMVGVDPAHRRQGFGQMLVEWGVEQAKKEECCATLESSPDGFPMYRKLGYQITKTLPADPSIGFPTFPAMVWQPDNSKVDWVGRARDIQKVDDMEE